jgi:pimeloyl-ACP methyl ester carboxylesterase
MTPRRRAAALLLAGPLLFGCRSVVRLFEAKEQIQELPTPCFLRGELRGAPAGADVFVVAVAAADDRTADFHAGRGDGSWWLILSRERHRIAGFADLDGDRQLGPSEPAALAEADACAEGQPAPPGVIRLALSDGVRIPFAIDLSHPDLEVAHRLGPAQLGQVASLDDERFSLASGERGLWQPIDFMQDPGGGLFLLEPWDPGRTPVLFVHGIGGGASQFRELIGDLDRRRFQALVVQYPSALRLELIADAIRLGLDVLHAELGFTRLVVVAHSMGGLVARALLNDLAQHPPAWRVERFATLSTPWAGTPAAASGVERSPVVIPSWRDMEPGSDFLTELFATSLRGGLTWHLFFSFEGNDSLRMTGGVNDGVVPIASQLAPAAQAQAHRLHGFPETHTSILSSPAVSEALNRALAGP